MTPGLLISDHAVDRMMEVVLELAQYSKSVVRQIIVSLYRGGVPWSRQFGPDFLIKNDFRTTPVYLACTRYNGIIVVKTVLCEDHAIANVSAIVKVKGPVSERRKRYLKRHAHKDDWDDDTQTPTKQTRPMADKMSVGLRDDILPGGSHRRVRALRPEDLADL